MNIPIGMKRYPATVNFSLLSMSPMVISLHRALRCHYYSKP